MALIVMSKLDLLDTDGWWFEVTVNNSTVRVLHTCHCWSAYGDTMFSLVHQGKEKPSFACAGTQNVVFITLEETSSMMLRMCGEDRELKDL